MTFTRNSTLVLIYDRPDLDLLCDGFWKASNEHNSFKIECGLAFAI